MAEEIQASEQATQTWWQRLKPSKQFGANVLVLGLAICASAFIFWYSGVALVCTHKLMQLGWLTSTSLMPQIGVSLSLSALVFDLFFYSLLMGKLAAHATSRIANSLKPSDASFPGPSTNKRVHLVSVNNLDTYFSDSQSMSMPLILSSTNTPPPSSDSDTGYWSTIPLTPPRNNG